MVRQFFFVSLMTFVVTLQAYPLYASDRTKNETLQKCSLNEYANSTETKPERKSTSPVLDDIRKAVYGAYPDTYLQRMVPGSKNCSRSTMVDHLRHHDPSRSIPTAVGRFFPSNLTMVSSGLRTFLSPGETFLDLGSGDGRVSFLAATHGLEVTGIEYDTRLIEISRNARDQLVKQGVLDKDDVRFIRADFFRLSWKQYDNLYYYGVEGKTTDRVQAKMKEELPSSSRVIVYREDSRGMNDDLFPRLTQIKQFPQSFLKIYRVPND
ncbi:MAG: class I SAM-dependent methyltransferase [bacterium]